jgi:hypothetical protein
VTVVPVLALSALGLVSATQGYWVPALQAAQRAQAGHAGFIAGCMSPEAITDERAASCTWNAGAPGTPIYLLGDSIADHYSEGLVAAATQLDRPLTVAVAAGCPIYPVVIAHDGVKKDVAVETELCGNYSSGTLAWMQKQPAGIVIIGETDSAWWNPSPSIPRDINPYFVSDRTKAAAVRAGMLSAVEALKAAGHTVVLAKPPPSFRYPAPAWEPIHCFAWQFAAGTCTTSRTVEQMDELQGEFRAVIQSVADETGSAVLDLRDYLCPDGVCSTTRDGELLYLDSIHLTADTSKALAPWFVRFLSAQDA